MQDQLEAYQALIEENSLLKRRLLDLERFESDYKRVEEALRERVKEMDCLYAMAELIEKTDSLEEILKGIVDQIPKGWYYPEHACARITVKDKEFKTVNFRKTEWGMSEDIMVRGRKTGTVDVFYMEKMPDKDEGPFIREERILINAIAKRLGKTIERKEAGNLLAESEKKYRRIVDNAYEGIMIIDKDSNISFVNARMAEMLGTTTEELTGRSYYSCMHEEDIANHSKQKEIRKKGQPGYHERRLLRKDGSVLWTINSFAPIMDEGGGFQGSLGMFTDISGLKLTVDRLRESEERYRIVIENSNDGITLVRDGIHVYVNNRFIEMFGYNSVDDAIGTPLTANVHPDDKGLVEDTFRKRLRGEPVPSSYEFKGIKKNGETLFVEASMTRIVYNNEPISLGFLRDITDRKRVEEEKMYSAKLESVLETAGAVCHELNQPLQVISGLADMLLMEHDGDNKTARYLKRMMEHIHKMGEITRKLMGIKRYATRDYIETVKIMDIDRSTNNSAK